MSNVTLPRMAVSAAAAERLMESVELGPGRELTVDGRRLSEANASFSGTFLMLVSELGPATVEVSGAGHEFFERLEDLNAKKGYDLDLREITF